MARKPRIHCAGAVYHVLLRGNAGQQIFFETADYLRFLRFMGEGIEKYICRVHAFCLMPNHIHMAIQVGDTPLSRIMQNLCFRYTQWMNRRRDRVGHLFQGRYKAVLVDANSYLLELVRYIHLNPVRAGMVKSPEAYLWSSHLSYLGERKLPWLTIDWVLSRFSSSRGEPGDQYQEFVHSESEGGQGIEFHRGTKGERRVLGENSFIEEVFRRARQERKKTPSMGEVIRRVCQHYGVEEKELSAAGKNRRVSLVRGVIAWLILESGGLTLAELSKRLNRDISTLSSAAKRLLILSNKDAGMSKELEGFRHEILEIGQLSAPRLFEGED
jgi:REP-associated tyrosine transposase